MKSKVVFRPVITGLLVLICSACSLQSMQKDTHDLKNTSDHIEGDSNRLAARTDNMYNELTKSESYKDMRLTLYTLFEQDKTTNSLNQTSYENGMVVDSCSAVRAMFFQTWKGGSGETLASLDNRFAMSLRLTLNLIADYIPREVNDQGNLVMKVDVLNPDRSYKAVASLGAMLDEMDPDFEASLKRAGIPRTTLYDVIETALKDRNQVKRTELFPQATTEVLDREQEAVYLLQLRQNYLPMLVAGWMTGIQDKGDLSRLWQKLVGQKVNLNQFTAEQLKMWTTWLNRANETREALRKMGIEPEYNGMLMGLVSKLNFGQQEVLAESFDKLDPMGKIRYQFAKAYGEVVNSYNAYVQVHGTPAAIPSSMD